MIKLFVTLFRGRAAEAAEAVADHNALPLLDQQIRDAAAALGRARRALALAMAQEAQEAPRLDEAAKRIADLEDRARQALSAGRDDLATEAAEAIAGLEAERSACRTAQGLFAAEAARLRRIVADAEARLAELDRGRRLARAAHAVHGMHGDRIGAAPLHEATLGEAEATLARLRARQAEEAAALEALDGLEAERRPASVAEKLAEAGFGKSIRPTAAEVLARLRASPATASDASR
ncbi:MAG: PspA/IM30 family protein [Acetobacteraceae bacterium]|nr:PspA/IM30 family protein [Acetobacteraceae bacterium]